MIFCYRSFAGYRPTDISRHCEGRSAVPELSPAQRRDENLALGLCVFMKVRIFFSTQILPDLQQSSTL